MLITKNKKLICLILIICILFLYNRSNNKIITQSKEHSQLNKGSKIFCLILTKIQNLKIKATAVYNGWANKCTDYRFISLIPDHNLTTDKIDTSYQNLFKILKPKGLWEDKYRNLTYKVLLAFEDVYEMHPDFDWYLKADDDTFIFYDNLQDFVATKQSTHPVHFGYENKVMGNFLSGGPGYVLSHEAMKRLLLKWREMAETFKGEEDVDVSRVLRSVGVYPLSSLDDKERERFHPFDLKQHYTMGLSVWAHIYAKYPLKFVRT